MKWKNCNKISITISYLRNKEWTWIICSARTVECFRCSADGRKEVSEGWTTSWLKRNETKAQMIYGHEMAFLLFRGEAFTKALKIEIPGRTALDGSHGHRDKLAGLIPSPSTRQRNWTGGTLPSNPSGIKVIVFVSNSKYLTVVW